MDSLLTLRGDLLRTRPAPLEIDAWRIWVASRALVIVASATPDQRWACIVLVADHLAQAFPDLSLPEAYRQMSLAVDRAARGPVDRAARGLVDRAAREAR